MITLNDTMLLAGIIGGGFFCFVCVNIVRTNQNNPGG